MKIQFSLRYFIALFTIFYLLHIIATFVFLTPKALISSNPIYTDDYPFHYYHCLLFKHSITRYHQFWAYNPHFSAGAPEPLASDLGNKFCAVFTLTFSSSSPIHAFKAFIMMAFLISPLLLYFGARNLGMTSNESLLCFIIGLMYWWGSQFKAMIYWGMFSYLLGLFLALYLFTYLYKWLKHPNAKTFIIMLLLSIILFWVHPLCALLIIVPAFIAWFFHRKSLSIKTSLLSFLIPLLALASAYGWLYPIFSQGYFFPQKGGVPLQAFSLLQPIAFYFQTEEPRNNFNLPILVLGFVGLYFWRKKKEKDKYLPFLLSYLLIFCLYYYFSISAEKAIFLPSRFAFAMNLFLLLPAALGIKHIAAITKPYFKKPEIRLALIILLILLIPIFLSPYLRIILPSPQPKGPLPPTGKPQAERIRIGKLSYSLSPDYQRLIDWIKLNTSREGRILLEDSGWVTYHKHNGGHMPGLLAFYTNREFIGGPYPYGKIFANFYEGWLFNRPIQQFSFPQLKKYMELYNIKWIISHSSQAIKYFSSSPRYFLFKDKIGDFNIYEVNRKADYFIKGEGKISAEINKIELSEIKGEEIIIKYHWISTLKTKPERPIDSIEMLEDPNGFIRILNPPPSLLIYNGY